MAKIADIPPEVLLQIFEHTRPDAHRSLSWESRPARESFLDYALVGRAWAATAQRVLFRIAQPSCESTSFLDSLKDLHRRGSALPNAVDKLSIDLGYAWSFDTLAQTIALCTNLRHIDLHYRRKERRSPPAGFTPDQLAIVSRVQSVTHLSASIRVRRLDFVLQMARMWPGLRFISIRADYIPQSESFRDVTLPDLRELRIDTCCQGPLSFPRLQTLTVHGSDVLLSAFAPQTLAHVRRLHLQVGQEFIHPANLLHLPSMERLTAITIYSRSYIDDLRALLDALPPHIEELGMNPQLLFHAFDISELIRTKRLQSMVRVVVYVTHEPGDFEHRFMKPIVDACSSSDVQLHIDHESELWEIPNSYN